LPDWIAVHVNVLAFLGGVPRQIVCDYVPRHIIAVLCR
jgi:transposase